jgi:hypothetical protein
MPSNRTENELTTSDETLPADESGFEPAPEDQPSEPVRDFLYHDARRVGSFLAQFEVHGLPQQVKATESVGQAQATKTAVTAGAKVPMVAHGQGTVDVTTTDDTRDAAERTYDPFWTNARLLLGYLDAHHLIRHDVRQARIGQFVQVPGSLMVVDLSMMKGLWTAPEVKTLALEAAIASKTQGRSSVVKNEAKKEAEKTVNVFLRLLDVMSHQIQGRIVADNGITTWFAVQQENLVGSAADLLLKHGIDVAGEWTVLGILDAAPDLIAGVLPTGAAARDIANVKKAFSSNPFGEILVGLSSMARQLGRPQNAYGITPLMIFRTIEP